MRREDNYRGYSILADKFSSEGEESPSGAQSASSRLAEAPLKLTEERFAAEERHLQDFSLREEYRAQPRESDHGKHEPATRLDAIDLNRRQSPNLESSSTRSQEAKAVSAGPSTEVRQARPQARPESQTSSSPRDPRAGVISHSHQKLHRSFLDADLYATRTADVPRPATPARPARAADPPAPRRRGGLRRFAITVPTLLLVAVIGYGYLAMRQNNISTQQLPGVQAVGSALRGPAGSDLRRAGSALESVGDRAAQFLAKEADRFDNWRKSR
jgi:hypothetical protein